MALPDKQNVLGNFNQQKAEHYSQAALFFVDKGEYKATITDTVNDTSETFTVKYTFGYYPLQQYLVATKPGTFQVLPFAWDARPAAQGGQRWYHNYVDERVSTEDRLHWRQPLQNWNGMCGDCHSDELKRNYEPASNSFNTQFSGINVGCVSCHGVMDNHLEQIQTSEAKSLAIQKMPLATQASNPLGKWTLSDDANTAIWKGPARDNEFMQTCFACHSLRAPLTDGFTANNTFLDQFSPSLITPPLYYADGQIKEEVFVYGSFLQSKMYANGVNCSDCHDPHTMKLKIEGNGLCLQCHKASEFDTTKHHKHTVLTEGAQCVNCHMPDKVYMGVDNRRDHSFKIPAPHLSGIFNTPNACTDCHKDTDNAWAASAIEKWYGQAETLSKTRRNLLRLRHGQGISVAAHFAIVSDQSIDVISRASALEMIPQTTQTLSTSQLGPFVRHTEDLIRLAAARIGNLVCIRQRAEILSPLLDDPLKSVRSAAAQALVGLPVDEQNLAVFTKAFNELATANENSAWRGEMRVNQGNIALQENNTIGAETAYKASVDIDPYFPIGYMNLADLYRAKQREDLVAQVLKQGLEAVPNSADVAYAYGLHLVRMKNIKQALDYFKRAMQLNPQNVQLAYTYALALDSSNQTPFAIQELKRVIEQYPNNASLIELGLYLARKVNSKADFDWFTQVNNR
ncbi:MAG: putative CXXCH cytochrome family protein [Alphaproteobacteria bacterium]|jgi:predicted CXXCH cytochrome family protein